MALNLPAGYLQAIGCKELTALEGAVFFMQAPWAEPSQAEPDPTNNCPQALANVVHITPRHSDSAVLTAMALARESPLPWPLAWRTLPSSCTWWPCLKLEDWYPKTCYVVTLPAKTGKKSGITGVKVRV